MEILEREIKRIVKTDSGMEEELKKVGEIINEEKDIVQTTDGKYVLRRQGVQKLADYVGATWGKPEIVDIPSATNDRGFFVLIECRFPDGTQNFGPGESTAKNTKIGSDFRFITAINRAKAISFLRSPYIGMYDVYSEEEGDLIKKQEPVSEEFAKMKKVQKQYQTMVNEMMKLIALPDEDGHYPKAYVTEVWDLHQDLDYLKALTKHEDKVIQWVAKQKLKEAMVQLESKEEEKTA